MLSEEDVEILVDRLRQAVVEEINYQLTRYHGAEVWPEQHPRNYWRQVVKTITDVLVVANLNKLITK
jgi:ribulose kinase